MNAYVILRNGLPIEVHLVEEDALAVTLVDADSAVAVVPCRHRVLIGTEKGKPTTAVAEPLSSSSALAEVLGRNGQARE